jgi:hypothetical protein
MNPIQKLSVTLAALGTILMFLNYPRPFYNSQKYYRRLRKKLTFFQISLIMLAIAIAFFIIGTYVINHNQ